MTNEEIKNFIDAKNVKTPQEYKDFIAKVNEEFSIPQTQFFKENDFYEAPASTKFHGHFQCGLVLHSLLLYKHLSELNEKLCCSYSEKDIWLSAMYHDSCKVNMYKKSYRNVKGIDGNWTQQVYYQVRSDYVGLGHGVESMVIYMRDFCNSPLYNEEVRDAIRWHMGFSDLSPMDSCNYGAYLEKSKLILLLNTADLMAANWDKV